MISINMSVLENISLNVNLDDKIYIIDGNSATGKSFLFDLLRECCYEADLKYSLINYNDLVKQDFSDSYVLKQIALCDFIVLDNADLYLTPNLMDKIAEFKNKCIVISIKNVSVLLEDTVNLDFDRLFYAHVYYDKDKIGISL